MKKWLIRCLTVLAMVCLIPGIVLKAAAETVPVFCARCETMNKREVLRYEKDDSTCHRVYVTECPNCHNDGDIAYIMFHTGGSQTPTCTTGKICEKCGEEYGILGHVWGAWTPNYDGTTYTHARSCKNCPEVDTANCTGGTATCSAKAVCEVCGGKYGERKPNNHDLVHHEAKAPTCTEIGWDAYEACSRCNYTTRKELPAQHDFVYHQAKPATCKEIGWDAYKTCSRCDYTNYQEIPTLNHDLRQYVTKAPTCKEIGFASITCWRCDYYASQVLPALNHDLKQYAAKAPTCTEKGWNAYETCSRSGCNYTTYVELPAQHDLVHHDAKAATCTEKGWDAYDTCSRLGCNYTTYQEISALKHDLVHHDAQAATCTEIGWDAYDTCSNCDYTTYVEIPASGHALTHHEAKAATCTEIGWDAYDTCSNCDYTTYVEIPASGHALTHHEAKAATCTEIGWDAYDTCSNCDYTTYVETPASSHVLTNYGENWDLVFCPVCGKVENGEWLELIETASAAAVDGKLPEGELVARMNQRYLSLAFVHEGKLTAPAGRVKITLPAEIVQGKRLLLIAPDGTETELPFEIVGETISFTLDFTEVENPAVLVLKPL